MKTWVDRTLFHVIGAPVMRFTDQDPNWLQKLEGSFVEDPKAEILQLKVIIKTGSDDLSAQSLDHLCSVDERERRPGLTAERSLFQPKSLAAPLDSARLSILTCTY
jgi:hypothetical protein